VLEKEIKDNASIFFLLPSTKISIGNPDEILFPRSAVFTTDSVAQLFEIRELVMDSTYHNPENLYSRKDTDITILPHKHNRFYY
jgi:hypothetical protein